MKTVASVKAALFAVGIFASQSLFANWLLEQDQSSVSFISIKNNTIAEVNHFKKIQGKVDDNGNATMTINLDSVDTMIGIRDERLRKLLFETVKFPNATITTQLNAQRLKQLSAGQTTLVEASYTLTLHGQKTVKKAVLRVTGLENGRVSVITHEPILIAVSDFNLVNGVEALKQVAKLSAISQAVPVNLDLVFTQQK
ncbi:Uncharacterised protein [BD1-7 clade bacterium]|uniref:Lipid/polyisoprenoid-binding YceI-like domain-containing protein n=1 Tax=BD1-7 clade bacterium TaxID=2029982 RepID=A0A5S9PN29_9GAMM|nr:Uncharacterised protein [BD1-7 clade bacterium]CAA0105898.1 Uncharacterised protein [BD1-7 clade bacterium]